MQYRDTSIRTTTGLDEIARFAQILHDSRCGWHRTDIEALVEAHPGWELKYVTPESMLINLDPAQGDRGPRLEFVVRKHGGKVYRKARILLAFISNQASESEQQRLRSDLVEALSGIGTPVAYHASSDGPGLRWHLGDRVMLLQGQRHTTWLTVHPLGTSCGQVEQAVLDAAAAVVEVLHDSETGHCDRADLERLAAERPGWRVGFDGTTARITVGPDGTELVLRGEVPGRYDSVRVHRYPEGAGTAGRRAAFGEVLDAVRGAVGDPSVHGGGPEGPDVRWRSPSRTLRLRGDRQGIALECTPTPELDEREFRIFGQYNSPVLHEDPSDFSELPYTWQLFGGPGGLGDEPPLLGGRLAATMEQLQAGLRTLLGAWVEQLAVQAPGERAKFKILNSCDRQRAITISLEPSGELRLLVSDRDGDAAAAETDMLAAGWERNGKRWRAAFPHADETDAATAARLIVTELAARGVTAPAEQLRVIVLNLGTVTNLGCLYVTGLGIRL